MSATSNKTVNPSLVRVNKQKDQTSSRTPLFSQVRGRSNLGDPGEFIDLELLAKYETESRSNDEILASISPENRYIPFNPEVGKSFQFEGRTYLLNDLLGEGGEGQTFLAQDDLGNLKTVKVYDYRSRDRDLVEKVNNLSPKFEGVSKALGRNYQSLFLSAHELVILGDYIEGENLNLYSKAGVKFNEEEIVDFLFEILRDEIKPLHEEGIIHRDIKPSNIILDKSENYRLIDFGSLRSNKMDGMSLSTRTIDPKTLGYCLMDGKAPNPQHDLYSAVKTAYSFMAGKVPDYTSNDEDRVRMDKRMIDSMGVSAELKKILYKGAKVEGSYNNTSEMIVDLEKYIINLKGESVEKDENASKNNLENKADIISSRIRILPRKFLFNKKQQYIQLCFGCSGFIGYQALNYFDLLQNYQDKVLGFSSVGFMLAGSIFLFRTVDKMLENPGYPSDGFEEAIKELFHDAFDAIEWTYKKLTPPYFKGKTSNSGPR